MDAQERLVQDERYIAIEHMAQVLTGSWSLFTYWYGGGDAGVGSYFQDALVTSLVSLDTRLLSRTVLEATTHPSVQRTPCKRFRNH